MFKYQYEKIELSATEVTAYWWIGVIRNKIREISACQNQASKDELDFLNIFHDYTERDWRNVYLGLVNKITEDINNYVPNGDFIGISANVFNQDTDAKGHDRLNSELCQITKRHIPDIRLSARWSYDMVIYTNMFGASVRLKSCGLRQLTTKYDASYILTGDEEILDFYNQLVATIFLLHKKDKKFDSIPILKKYFCEEYKKNQESEQQLQELYEKFDYIFKRAYAKDVIGITMLDKNYYSKIKDIDLVCLDKYMKMADIYANAILNQFQKILTRKKARARNVRNKR